MDEWLVYQVCSGCPVFNCLNCRIPQMRLKMRLIQSESEPPNLMLPTPVLSSDKVALDMIFVKQGTDYYFHPDQWQEQHGL